ncbi:hypothetical protein Pyrde_1826 [Pyrodictium delaneyi]|uniref:Uncharacterized protein n=2 Tax=Pyrodictium delaneyi TaxID=1273541 RepID=A0A0P0N5Z4_9CREN|nr:hypothetical protein Pyrde_1826 [Pyrodictium delaneyi]
MVKLGVNNMKWQLDELSIKILLHLYTYGPDTPSLLSRRLLGERTNIDVSVVEQTLAESC